jgi:hypothetical protein
VGKSPAGFLSSRRVKIALLSHATTANEMNDWIHHPIYTRLMAPCEPFARHALLHSIELELGRLECCPKLASRVHHFVERGVPYFAPADAHYREWAAKAASLWDELHARSGSEQESSLV